jgi:hypothetical protein
MKKLLALSVLVLSTQSFASELVSRELVVTPGFKGNSVAAHKDVADAEASAMPEMAYGKVNQPVMMRSYHSASLINRTNRTQQYTVELTLECEGARTFDKMTYTLSPNERRNISQNVSLVRSFTSPRSYPISAKTLVNGTDGSYRNAFGNNSAFISG